jgi:hypothetical protein
MPKLFIFPLIVWIVSLVAMYLWGGAHAFFLAAVLTILEVTLSFDNAVVNAKILAKMDAKWQGRFLTWGIFIAVFLTRFVLPILIVAASVGMAPYAVAMLAAYDPAAYGHLLEGAHEAIAAFGGAFLVMVSLKYFFDTAKEVHWLHFIERHLSRWGRIEAIEIALTLVALLIIGFLIPEHAGTILSAGVIGIVLFIMMQGVANAFTLEAAGAGSFALFIYLNILDAAFSLDGVVGAFAITDQLPIIVVGLGVGAYFVRSLTLYLVQHKTLDTLEYLEHGAHYAILGLALAMFASIFVKVPEAVTGLVGLVFVGAALWSSLKKRKQAHA